MLVPVHLESSIPSVFEIIASTFKEATKDAFNTILIRLILSMKNKREELIELYKDIELDNDILLNKDLESFYDALIISENDAKSLFKMATKHKDKSDIFMQFYIASDELYDTLAKVTYDLGTIESKLIHEGKLEYAS